MIAAVSPSDACYEDTLNTLKCSPPRAFAFAFRALFLTFLQIRKSSERNQNKRAPERAQRGAPRQVHSAPAAAFFHRYCTLKRFMQQPLRKHHQGA